MGMGSKAICFLAVLPAFKKRLCRCGNFGGKAEVWYTGCTHQTYGRPLVSVGERNHSDWLLSYENQSKRTETKKKKGKVP